MRSRGPGGELQQGTARRDAPLADQEHTVRFVEGEDGDRAGVDHDLAAAGGAVGPLDLVDPQLHVVTAMDRS